MSDLVPNEGSFYLPPEDEAATIKANKERAEVSEILPFLQKTIDWFDLQAAEFDKVSNLQVKGDLPIEAQLQAYQMVIGLLNTKKGELQSYMNTYDWKQR